MRLWLIAFQSPKIGSVVSNECGHVVKGHLEKYAFQSPKIGSVVSNFNFEIAMIETMKEMFQSPKIGSVVSNIIPKGVLMLSYVQSVSIP